MIKWTLTTLKWILKYVGPIYFLWITVVSGQPSVAFFYGVNPPLSQLCGYDLAVIDPSSNFSPNDYCTSLSQPIAYVSLGEVAHTAPYANKIHLDWVNGVNKAWNNNFVMDQTNKEWQTFFLDQLIAPLWEKGYHGFFLDTLDSYYLVTKDPKLQQKQIEGIIYLIQQIKHRYPDAKIILNRGFDLLPKVRSDIYAVVIESLYHAWNQAKHTYEATSQEVQAFLSNKINAIRLMQLPIIIIDYLPEKEKDKAPALAEQLVKQGLIPWITDNQLETIYISSIHSVPRKILVLFTDEEHLPLRFFAARTFMGAIFEYMGYVLEYQEIQETPVLQEGDLSTKYSGIILWLDTQDNKYVPVLNWVQTQIAHNIPIVFLQSFGVPIDNDAITKLGLSTSPEKDSDDSLKITKINPYYVGAEQSPPITPYDFYPLKADSSDVLLQMENGKQQLKDAIAITPWGGYALLPYVIQVIPDVPSTWILNPFEFFSRALRLKPFPVPDTTTENGRRLMSVHIDGDGFAYQAKWIGGGYAGAELRDRIIKTFRIPTSFSVITGEIGPNGIHPKQAPELMAIARSIFELPWVECASHTFSHPFYWQKSNSDSSMFHGEEFAMHIPHYKFNIATEITGSVDFINQNLLAPNKQCNLLFWSGLSNPTAKAIALTYQNNLLNINGISNTHIDNRYPSLTGIQPMGMKFGDYYQVFAPIDMDFYYTNSLSGPLYGFKTVIQTFQHTDKPRRFKPIDIYYHVYAADNVASLQAVKEVYRWAMAQPVMNIYISDYIKKVLDYFHVMISKRGNSWVIETHGELRELHSERSLGYPNLSSSQNVIGFNEHNNIFYIHLGPNRLTVLNYQPNQPTEPYLLDANARVTAFSRNNNQLVIRFQGYMPLQFTMANVSQCTVSSDFPLNIIHNTNKTISYSSTQRKNEIHFSC